MRRLLQLITIGLSQSVIAIPPWREKQSGRDCHVDFPSPRDDRLGAKVLTNWFGLLRPVIVVAVFVIIAVLAQQPKTHQADAGAITNISASVADPTISTSTTYTVNLTVASIIPASTGRINLRFYGAYWDMNFNSAAVATGTSPTSIYLYNRNWDGVTLYTTSDIAAGSSIVIKLSGVVNPSRGGYYTAHVSTSNYSTDIDGTSDYSGNYNSPYFQIGTNTNVTGTVTNASSTPIAYANVYMYSSNYSNYYYGYTDVNGVYGLDSIPAGTYTIGVYSSNGYQCNGVAYASPATSSITVASAGTVTKNFSFPAITKTITGKITKNSSTGAAVDDANISTWLTSGSGYACSSTDSSGNYSLSVSGGTWSTSVYPKNWPANWTYNNAYETLTFASDSTTESKTKDYIVESLSSTITGSIAKPSSATVNQYDVGMSLYNTKNQWFSVQMSSSGNSDGSRNFTALVTPGTYSISGWVSDNTLSFPKVDNFTVEDGATKNLGVIELVAKNDTIAVTVTDNTSAGVQSAWVSAWRNDGTYDWASCQTASDGTCTLRVTPGTWQVSAWPQWKEGGYDHVYSGKPKSVVVSSGVAASTSFSFQKVTATIKGTVTDADDNVLSTLNSWASANDGSQQWSNIGGSVTNGTFSLRVPAGTWDVNVYIWGGDYGTADPVKVTVADNETATTTIKTVRNNATISGTVYDENNEKVTGKWMSIYATKGKYGTWQSASLDQSAATYSIKVSAGTWNLGWWIDQSLGYSSGTGQDVSLDIKDSESKTYDIHLKKADSTISGKAKKSDGTNMQWAWITADTRDPNEKKSADSYYYSNGGSSNNNGDYSLKVPAGTYFVGANMWPGSGYINPKRQKVTVDSTHPASIDLTFRSADATISGTVTQAGNGVSSYISAWSEDGGYSEANSSNSGNYSLSVSSGDTWHVTALLQDGTSMYKSDEAIVDLSNSKEVTKNLELKKLTYSIPKSKTITFDPSNQQTITLDDGTVLNIPANAITTSSGNVTLTAEPAVDLAQENDAKPVGYGYNFTITDSNGVAISKFVSSITIEYKYDSTWLLDSKVTSEGEMTLAWYDNSAATWIELPNCNVNSETNTITCQVDHFTRFAIVAATDSTPPAAPSSTAATASDASVIITWTKPSDSDFTGVNIYQSTTSGSLGSKIATASTATTHIDTGLTNGTTYYYTLKSVDTSSNESISTTQINATPATPSASSLTLPTTGSSIY